MEQRVREALDIFGGQEAIRHTMIAVTRSQAAPVARRKLEPLGGTFRGGAEQNTFVLGAGLCRLKDIFQGNLEDAALMGPSRRNLKQP